MLPHIDLLYVVRVQREIYASDEAYERQLRKCRMHKALLSDASSRLMILHCLPRSSELDIDVDGTMQNKYFLQAAYGVPVRMAVMARYASQPSNGNGPSAQDDDEAAALCLAAEAAPVC